MKARQIFISFHRYYIDKFLDEHTYLMNGKVLDIGGLGGKGRNRRGYFRPPLHQVDSWDYLNIDKSTNPNYVGSAETIPIKNSVFETIIFCEVLEHLKNPESALGEIYRVLKEEGKLIMTVPFLYPFHADPNDYQRWTSLKLYEQLSSIGFKQTVIKPMGGLFAVIFDLIISSVMRSPHKGSFVNRKIEYFLRCLAPIFKCLDNKSNWIESFITTGYFIVAYK
jgi:SAM-dependent methyltransferase